MLAIETRHRVRGLLGECFGHSHDECFCRSNGECFGHPYGAGGKVHDAIVKCFTLYFEERHK